MNIIKSKYLITAVVLIGVVFLWTQYATKSAEEKIKVGVISSLTGPASYYGQSTKNGADIALAEMREKYPNLDLELIHEDSALNPATGANAYNKLKSVDKVGAVVVQGGNIGVVVHDLAAKDNILVMGSSVLSKGFKSPDDLSFRMTANGEQEISYAVKYISQSGYKKIAVIYIKNEIGETLKSELVAQAPSKNIQIVAEEGYDKETSDFRTILSKVKTSNPDLIYVAGIAANTAQILKQANELNIQTKFMSFRAVEDPVLLKDNPKLAEGLIYTNAFSVKSVDSADFVKKYNEIYKENPNGYAAEAYEGTKLVLEALIECRYTTDTLCHYGYLRSQKDRKTVFGNIYFDEFGDVTYNFFLKTVTGGQFVEVR